MRRSGRGARDRSAPVADGRGRARARAAAPRAPRSGSGRARATRRRCRLEPGAPSRDRGHAASLEGGPGGCAEGRSCERMFVSANEPSILHADADAFFASVEQRDDPSLRGRPVIVGGGVVMAASYEARRCGVRGAMNGARPAASAPTRSSSRPASRPTSRRASELFELFGETSPVVEGLSLEEAFLDVRGLERISGTPRRSRHACGAGRASGSGSRHRRDRADEDAGEDGEPGGEARRAAAGRARARARVPAPAAGRGALGGRRFDRRASSGARDRDRRPARRAERAGAGDGRSAAPRAATCTRSPATATRGGCARAAAGARSARSRRSGAGRRSPRTLDAVLVSLADRITRRMRAAASVGRTVTVRLRFGDYTRASRRGRCRRRPRQPAPC